MHIQFNYMKMTTSFLFMVSLVLCLVLVSSNAGLLYEHDSVHEQKNSTSGRKLLNFDNWTKCSNRDIQIAQGMITRQPNGIPTYLVEITNTNTKVAISNIHLSCGQFSSAIQINPRVFKRLAVDDCLVNNGSPLAPGIPLSFKYATNFKYPLSVATIKC